MNSAHMTNERLYALAQQGDISSRNRLVVQNLGFVRDTAGHKKRFMKIGLSAMVLKKVFLMKRIYLDEIIRTVERLLRIVAIEAENLRSV